MTIATSISTRIRQHAAAMRGSPALIPYITAGFPTKAAFRSQLLALAPLAGVIEVGVPFSDPMADGATIQDSSRTAIQNGVTLSWILDELAAIKGSLEAPIALMSYLNPLITAGLDSLADNAARAGVAAFIIPDLPLEESAPLRAALHAKQIGLIQLVSPITPPARAEKLAQHSDGFLYAVTVTGVTGTANRTSTPREPTSVYLDRLCAISPVPVCAGFGIRTRDDVARLSGHADGAIVGSALINAIGAGQDPAQFLRSLR